MTATQVKQLSNYSITVKHNGELAIALGKSRFETAWKNRTMQWSALLSKLSKNQQTTETHAEYIKLPKDRQDQIKDIGGFVGGHLKGGRRKSGSVVCRQIITLDLDFAPKDLWAQLMDNLDLECAMAIYSTHKHTAQKPRLRLIMPLDREVSPDEYEAITRKVAEKVGIDYFDDTTYQPTRLMYWPSNCADVEPVFAYYDAPFLSADDVLAEYPDWTDMSYWPESSRRTGIRKKMADRQGNPLEKKGIVGAFCRTYSLIEAIEKFLPKIYTPTAKEDRYTYAAGSTAAGLVVYEGGLFAFSNHGTDPASGQLCNAFDLVRIHRFGHLDEDAPARASGKHLPSFKAMAEFAADDPDTKRTILADNQKRAEEDFADPVEDDGDSWTEKLDVNDKGALVPNAHNALTILRHDPKLKGIRFNELSGAVEAPLSLPWARPNIYWSNADDAQLFIWVSVTYRVNFTDKIFQKALTTVTHERSFNPLREYVQGLPEWDGAPRVDRLFIDYLGADDTEYTRAVTRKSLVGAINRVLEPGCKFDTVLVLDGKPGIGKSTILSKLGGAWFSDSLNLADTRDKTAAEKLQGVWIMEIGEMQGTRKADVDILKGFLSRQIDEYRPAYGQVVERHPRTCVIFGTTNATTGFLRDTTGNRRFWPVPVSGGKKSVWNISSEERDQIWAEALALSAEGEEPYLSPALEAEAAKMQQAALEYDDREGSVIEYLDTLLPADWYSWDTYRRVDYFQQTDPLSPREEGVMRRDKVSALEIFCECLGRPRNTWKKIDGYEIGAIMARLPEWERTGTTGRISGYGKQRIYTRKGGNN